MRISSFNCLLELLRFRSFSIIVDLFDKQIERRVFMITLSRRSKLHRYPEAIGMVIGIVIGMVIEMVIGVVQ